MRASAIAALLVLIAAASGHAQAEPNRPTADTIRPTDITPSIPLERPVIDTDGTSQPPAGGTSGSAGDPSTPVSSDDPIDPSAGAGPGVDPSAFSGPAGAEPGQDAGAYQGGIPERAAPPRTLRAHWHVFIAFAVVWALLFGYAISVGRRFGRLEDEVRRLGTPAP